MATPLTGETEGRPRSGYQPALDGVRAVAFAAVMLFHGNHLTGGGYGVNVFFVLSGFLITTLLLEEHKRTGRIRLGLFWARRALRLFPAIFVLAAAMFVYSLFDHSAITKQTVDGLPWVLLYVGNWAIALGGHTLGLLFHTWSLAVEEQFYLLWPLVIVAIYRLRRPLPVLLAVALGGSVLSLVDRVLLHVTVANGVRTYGTDYIADQLLIGCALAVLLALLTPEGVLRLRRWLGALFPVAVVFLAAVAVGIVLPADAAERVRRLPWALSLIGLTSAVVIGYLVLHRDSPAARLLSLPPLAYTGRISYGLYLWHIPVFRILNAHGGIPEGLPLLGAKLVLTFGAAALSYRFVETPMLRLKNRFRAPGAGLGVAPPSPASDINREAGEQ